MGHGFDSQSNALLYSVVSWPNVVLALFGGFIVDRVTGIRKGAVIFAGLILLGQSVFSLGVQLKSFPVAVVGRVLFGLGSESLTVVQNTITVRWFSGHYLALVFGVVLAFARVGSSVNFALTPILTKQSVPFALWSGTATCVFSFIMTVILVTTDYINARYVEAPAPWVAAEEPSPVANHVHHHNPGSAGIMADPTGDNAAVIGSYDAAVHNKGAGDSEGAGEEQHVSLADIGKFPLPAWILFLICVFFYQGVLTFYQVASKIMQETGKHYNADTASLFLAIPNFISIGASPMFGRLVDSKGYSVTFLIVAAGVLSSCHVMFLADAYDWLFIHPAAIMSILGFAYALGAASMWPLLPLIIAKPLVTTGFGLMTAIQNLGLSVFPLLISSLQKVKGIEGTKHQYGIPIIVFIACVGLSSLLAIWLLAIDRRGDGRLNASAQRRDELDLLAEAEASGFVSINDPEHGTVSI